MITPAQCRAGRALLGIEQRTLAAAAVLAVHVVDGFERGTQTLREADVAALQVALEAAGVIFLEENGEGAGVRLAKTAKAAVARKEAEAAVDRALADVDADDAEKDRRKKALTRVPKDIKLK